MIHDPLYKWALTPTKALQRQQEGDSRAVGALAGTGPASASRNIGGASAGMDLANDGERTDRAYHHKAACLGLCFIVHRLECGLWMSSNLTQNIEYLVHLLVGATEAALGNADAERAVLCVRQKLEGTEGGRGEPRGVPGQVRAMDTAPAYWQR